jgi:hypothetical protein
MKSEIITKEKMENYKNCLTCNCYYNDSKEEPCSDCQNCSNWIPNNDMFSFAQAYHKEHSKWIDFNECKPNIGDTIVIRSAPEQSAISYAIIFTEETPWIDGDSWFLLPK